jgi:hypothetical protein
LSILNQHLVRRGAIYHFRRRLPSPLKEILSRSHFDGSLQTADPALARRLARKVTVALDQLAEALQGMPPARQPTPGQLNLVLKELFDSILRDGDRRRELQGDDFPALGSWSRKRIKDGEADPDELEAFEYCQRLGIFYDEVPEATAEHWRDRASFKLLDGVDPLLTAAFENAGIEVDSDESYPTGLRQDALAIIAQAFQFDLERWNGIYGAEQRAPGWIDDKYPMALRWLCRSAQSAMPTFARALV